MMIRKVMVRVLEKGYELDVAELVPFRFTDLVQHRVFATLNDMNYTLMALTYDGAAWGSCPADVNDAVEKIRNLPKY